MILVEQSETNIKGMGGERDLGGSQVEPLTTKNPAQRDVLPEELKSLILDDSGKTAVFFADGTHPQHN